MKYGSGKRRSYTVPILACAAVIAWTAASAWAAEPEQPWQFSAQQFRPFWLSDTMEGESVLFIVENGNTSPRASLLFAPTRVVSVCSSSGKTVYEEGKDYVWKPGSRELTLPPSSRISFKTLQQLRRPAGSQPYRLTHRDGKGEILFGAGHEYHDMQTLVTYVHQQSEWAGPAPAFAGDRLARTLKRLTDKQPLTIALWGDSISTGCNASGWAKVEPFQPAYQDLLVLNLHAAYGSRQVTLRNLAVGGTDTGWGLANISQVIEAKPDLCILAFGMNDAAGRPAPEYQANILGMIKAVRQSLPDTEFILVATMLGNRDWITLKPDLFPQYRDALTQLGQPGIAVADMTSIWETLLTVKQDWDLTGNGVNHPNDFGHRVYAQVLSALLISGDLRGSGQRP